MFTTYFFSTLVRGMYFHPARRSDTSGALSRKMTARRHARHLEELPDYLLDDIGLTRGDIRRMRRWW